MNAKAHLVLSGHVGAGLQKDLRDLQVPLLSGGMEGSAAVLRSAGSGRQLSGRWNSRERRVPEPLGEAFTFPLAAGSAPCLRRRCTTSRWPLSAAA